MHTSFHRLARSLITALLLGLSACSQLSVQVDVLRPEVVAGRADADAVQRVMPEIVAEDDLSVTRVFVDLQQTHFDAYQKLADQYTEEAKSLPKKSPDRALLEGAAQSLAGGVSPDLKQFYRRKESEVKAANGALRALWTEYGTAAEPARRESLARQILAGLQSRQAILSSVYTMIGHDLDEQASAQQSRASPGAPAIIASAETQVRRNMKQLFDGGGLIDSRYTYYVVRAPDPDWAPMFDRTLARGIFGNTDIAIKALGPGNFTIKGLSFNPADVAAAASKVGAQTVLLAAQIAGVPVNLAGSPAPGTNGGALATSSTAFSKVLADTAKNTEKVRVHRDALLRLAASILQERDSIANGTNAERKAAIDSIKAVYESHAASIVIGT